MDEYIGPTNSDKTEAVPLFESPTNEATNEKDVSSEDPGDATESPNHCSFCGRRVSLDDPTTYSEVLSWIRGPRKDSSVLRKYTGSHACGDCIAKLRSGLSPKEVDFETALDAPAESAPAGDIFTDRSASYATGYADGYAGQDAEPMKYEVDAKEYRDGWYDGGAKALTDKIRRELGEGE